MYLSQKMTETKKDVLKLFFNSNYAALKSNLHDYFDFENGILSSNFTDSNW